jgi:hypothetical protein
VLILPIIVLFMNIALFYLIVRWITGEETVEFQRCLIWVVAAWALGLGARLVAGSHGLDLPEPMPKIAQIMILVGTLAVILWHQGIRMRHVWTIIGMYFVAQIGLFFFMMILQFA